MNAESCRSIITRRGTLRFPAYIPVSTYDDGHPLDALVRPYLPRLATAVMISYHFARQHQVDFPLPVLIDSGGFASLRSDAVIREERGLGVIMLQHADHVERVHPTDVLDVQESQADIAFSLDFPVPPNAGKQEAQRRIELSLSNAAWALENRRRRDLPLYACVPVTDLDTLRRAVTDVASAGFDGIALGGLVPRVGDTSFVSAAVETARTAAPDLPLHVFGLGKPQMVVKLFKLGVDSVDSSSYVRAAADGKLWDGTAEIGVADLTPLERLHIALCNLASATGVALPISMAGVAFSTHSLARFRRAQ